MNELSTYLTQMNNDASIDKPVVVDNVINGIKQAGYTIVEINDRKPWGAYIRFDNSEADRFVNEFFPGLTPEEARLGIENAELSPKILLVAPRQRLSWQYHDRRAERWAFLTEGGYCKSSTDEESEVINAEAGDVVQFIQSERHRLVGTDTHYTLVAEIWQHRDTENLSNEEDIVRVADDYKR
jgi:mannose-6-phosphate isomerase